MIPPPARNVDVMVARFFNWWFSELGALVPSALVSRADTGEWLTVELGEERLRAVREGKREQVLMDLPADQAADLERELSSAVAGVDPRRVRCRVVLPRRQVLVREFELPLAAEENLREVLGFEMSRRTPFRVEDVHFDFQIVSRDSARQCLKLRLEVVPRPVLAPVLAALRAWDLSPAPGVAQHRASEDKGHAAFGFNAAAFRARPHSRLNMALGVVVVALVAALIWMPFERQRDYRQELEGRLDQARLAAARVASLRDELSAERDARALVTNARGERPSMVALMEELTRALPDGTYLFRLEVDRDEVNLHGTSDGASGLIAILEDTPHLKAVRFASPVTRDGTTGHERFHIVATLTGGPAAAAVDS